MSLGQSPTAHLAPWCRARRLPVPRFRCATLASGSRAIARTSFFRVESGASPANLRNCCTRGSLSKRSSTYCRWAGSVTFAANGSGRRCSGPDKSSRALGLVLGLALGPAQSQRACSGPALPDAKRHRRQAHPEIASGLALEPGLVSRLPAHQSDRFFRSAL
jgi:hypothetical protein